MIRQVYKQEISCSCSRVRICCSGCFGLARV